jgi:SAM-dependent methyltransferase
VFAPQAFWSSVDDERARYSHHDNTLANAGYVQFLSEVADVVCGLAGPGARGLDFGSGQNAVLTALLRERGLGCVAYDPLYGIGPAALREQYDVVVLCEVIEHLRELRPALATIGACLRPGGRMVVRTQCYPSVAEVPSWWYARDPTHLNFFAERTLALAAGLAGLRCRRASGTDIFVWSPPG